LLVQTLEPCTIQTRLVRAHNEQHPQARPERTFVRYGVRCRFYAPRQETWIEDVILAQVLRTDIGSDEQSHHGPVAIVDQVRYCRFLLRRCGHKAVKKSGFVKHFAMDNCKLDDASNRCRSSSQKIAFHTRYPVKAPQAVQQSPIQLTARGQPRVS